MDAYQKAKEIVGCYQATHRPSCCCFVPNNSGIPGPTGPTGPAPSFAIGSVTTGAPGTNAVVTLRPINSR